MYLISSRDPHLEFQRDADTVSEVPVFTWRDASLREITDLLQSIRPALKEHNTQLSFYCVYPHHKGRRALSLVGSIFTLEQSHHDAIHLCDTGFQRGDLVYVHAVKQ